MGDKAWLSLSLIRSATGVEDCILFMKLIIIIIEMAFVPQFFEVREVGKTLKK